MLDRGYFSFELLHAIVRIGAHPVFRLQRNSAAAEAGRDARRKLRAAFGGELPEPVRLRLVRCPAEAGGCCLATTLADAGRYSVQALSELYWGRWGIEELYKVSKHAVEVD